MHGFSSSSSSDRLTEEQENEIAENIYDWWISGKSYKQWYAEKFQQLKLEFNTDWAVVWWIWAKTDTTTKHPTLPCIPTQDIGLARAVRGSRRLATIPRMRHGSFLSRTRSWKLLAKGLTYVSCAQGGTSEGCTNKYWGYEREKMVEWLECRNVFFITFCLSGFNLWFCYLAKWKI